jgi:hypothetical protein
MVLPWRDNMQNQLTDHEVRIRLLEKIAEGIEKRFDGIEAKMDSNFHWVLGIVITSFLAIILTDITLFGGIIFHMAKLT